MTRREREHYEIAKRFGPHRPFTRLEFNSLYRQEYAERASPPIPTDFCINLYAKSAERFPKFLRWLGRGRYEFIDDQPGQALLQFQTDHYRKMAPMLTAEDHVLWIDTSRGLSNQRVKLRTMALLAIIDTSRRRFDHAGQATSPSCLTCGNSN